MGILQEDPTPDLDEKRKIRRRELLNRLQEATPSIVAEERKRDEERRGREAGQLLRKTQRAQHIRGLPQPEGVEGPQPITPPTRYDSDIYTPKVPFLDDPDEIGQITTPGREAGMKGTDVVNFLFGPEMAIMGVKHDEDGFSHEWSNAVQQWSDAPLWVNLLSTTSLVGSLVFPAVKAFQASYRVGKLGQMFGKFGSKVSEIEKYKQLGILSEKTTDISKSTLRLIRQQEIDRARYATRAERIAKAEKGGKLGPWERSKFEFDRRFGNAFYRLSNDLDQGTNFRQDYHNRLDKFWKAEDIGKFFVSIPEEAAGPKLYGYWLNRLNPGRFPTVKLSSQEQKWAEYLGGSMRMHQEEALAAGMITEDTFKHIGAMHIPAINKATPDLGIDMTRSMLVPVRSRKPVTGLAGITQVEKPRRGLGRLFGKKKTEFEPAGEYEYVALSTYNIPRLDSPTLLTRKADLPEVYRRLQAGELITDPADLTMRGYVMDRLLLHNFKFMRDVATDDRFAVTAADIASKFGTSGAAEAAGFVNMAKVGGHPAAIIKRMIEKKTGKAVDDLPWIRKEIYDEMFGADGMWAQTQASTDAMELLTTIYKTSKTAFSIPTHMQNFGGNGVFLAQSGFNILKPDNVRLMANMASSFNKIAQLQQTARKAGIKPRVLFDPKNGMLKGVNLGKITHRGKTFDLNEELFDPAVRELIEESAFQTVEGYQHLENMLGRLTKDQLLTRSMAKGFLKSKSMLQLGDKKGFRWFDNMTKAYLGEDMVPKMAYYLDLRAQGLTKSAAVLEVGKRLPMYSTVGSTVRRGRRFLFPWLTFPTEAVRITKNNLLDHPIRMMPWLRMPQIIQSSLYATGLSPDPAGVEEATRSLPFWAQKSTTVVTKGKAGAAIGGAATGALLGGAAGGVLAQGAGGAAVGAAIGAAIGGFGAAALTDEQQGDRLRGALMDWLPHSSFMLASTSPEFGTDTVPWKDMQGALEQMPAEPLAILKPLLDIVSGETAYGTPIGAEDTSDQVGKAIAGLIGFVAPPIIQKYGFKITTPDVSMFEAATGEKIPGDITNVAKLLVDTGVKLDPMTGKPGSFSHDFVLNNLSMWRSYAADPATRLSNEGKTEQHQGQVRSFLSRQLSFHLAQGNDDAVNDILQSVMSTFTRQHIDNPRLAQEKYAEWIERRLRMVGRHPKLRNWNEEEMLTRLRQASNFAVESRVQAREEMLDTLRSEMKIRKLRSLKQRQMRGVEPRDPRQLSRIL